VPILVHGSSYSMDDCASFANIDTGSAQYTCVSMLNATYGWAGGFNTNAYEGGIFRWNPLTSGPTITTAMISSITNKFSYLRWRSYR